MVPGPYMTYVTQKTSKNSNPLVRFFFHPPGENAPFNAHVARRSEKKLLQQKFVESSSLD